MSVTAELADGRTLEFPDGTDPAVVQATVKKMLAQASPTPASAPQKPSLRSQIIEQGINMVRPGGMGAGMLHGISQVGNYAGENVNDAAAKVMPAPFAAGLGAVTNAAIQAAPMFVGGEVGKATAPVMRSTAEELMHSALKPGVKAAKGGADKQIVDTLLNEGVNVTRGGVNKLQVLIDDLNSQIGQKIGASNAKIDPNAVVNRLAKTKHGFAMQADPHADLAAISAVEQGFKEHPFLAGLGDKEAELASAVAQKNSAAVKALQDAGRYQTMAAQQANLAKGGGVNIAKTPLNEPYINVGTEALGEGRALSPSAYPSQSGMIGQPRIPARYTENAQRVPEAKSAAEELLNLAAQRKAEAAQAQAALDAHRAAGGSGLPVQLAQEMKQGTYRVLKDKYGELGSASTEAQKALARGLKEEIAAAVPEVGPLNARESALLQALSPLERRVLVEANRNPAGLALLTHRPDVAAAFMADKSSAFKSILARMLNSGQTAIPRTAGQVIGAGPALINQGNQQ